MEYYYTASVTYKASKERHGSKTVSGFASSQDALNWIAKEVSKLMVNWYEIGPDGLRIVGRITCDEIGFDEAHIIQCGL